MQKLPYLPKSTYGNILKEIGRGVYGVVSITDKNFVIKTIKTKEDGFADDSALHEITSLRLATSDHVLPLIDVLFGADDISLVFPLAKSNLTALLLSQNLDTINIIRDICAGMADFHAVNVLHLDLKHDNILIHEEGDQQQAWIADPGISNLNACAFVPQEEVGFTIWWRPLEVLNNLPPTKKSDIWSLGLVIAEIILNQGRARGRRVLELEGKKTDPIENRYFISQLQERSVMKEIVNLVGVPNKPLINPKTGFDVSKMTTKSGNQLEFILLSLDASFEEVEFVKWILQPHPDDRPDISDILNHPFLDLQDTYDMASCQDSLEYVKKETKGYDFGDTSFYSDQEFMRKRGLYIIKMAEIVKKYMKDHWVCLGLAVYLFDKFMSYKSYKEYQDKELVYYLIVCLQLAYNFYGPSSRYSGYNSWKIILSNVNIQEYIGDSFDLFFRQMKKFQKDVLITTDFDFSVVLPYMYIYEKIKDMKFSIEDELLLVSLQVWILLTDLYVSKEPEVIAQGIVDIIDSVDTEITVDIIDQEVDDDVLFKMTLAFPKIRSIQDN